MGRAVVLLEPCLVVAKVSPLTDMVRCETEVALATHILHQQGPVVPPLLQGEPGPHRHGDAVVSFWEHCSSDGASTNHRDIAVTAYSQLAPYLQSYTGALPDFRTPIHSCRRAVLSDRLGCLSSTQQSLLITELGVLDQLDLSPEDTRNLHGDPHIRNLIRSNGETLWLDLKAACTGPLEWDLSALPHSAFLDNCRPNLLHQLKRLRSACVVVCCALKEAPNPVEVEAIRVHLKRLASGTTD